MEACFTQLNVPRCSTLQKKLHRSPRQLIATSSSSIRGGKGWPGSKGSLSVPLFFCVHARQDASSLPPLSPLLWLWLPPDVTPLLVTAQTLSTDFVVSMYLSQLFSLAVKFTEFHTLRNHYSVFFFMREEIYKMYAQELERGKHFIELKGSLHVYARYTSHCRMYKVTELVCTEWNRAQFCRAPRYLGNPFQSQGEIHKRCAYWLIPLA